MSFKVTVHPTVRRQIGETGMSRNAVVRLLANLYAELRTGAIRFRHNRMRGQPSFFRFHHAAIDGGSWHECVFVVKDDPEEMFVYWLFHKLHPRKQ